jgi:hypothetical protein
MSDFVRQKCKVALSKQVRRVDSGYTKCYFSVGEPTDGEPKPESETDILPKVANPAYGGFSLMGNSSGNQWPSDNAL